MSFIIENVLADHS